MVKNFTGIVLRTIKHSDNLMIADMYTLSRGRMAFAVSISRGRKSKVRNVLFQPLSTLSFNANCTRHSSLPRLSEAYPLTIYSSIQTDVIKTAIALYLSEFLCLVLREEEENEPLFRYLDYAFSWFDEAQKGYSDFHIIFLLHLTRFLGIFPNIEDVDNGRWFDLAAGSIVNEHPLHSHYLPEHETQNFIRLLNADFDSAGTFALNRKSRSAYLTLIEEYYSLHIPGFSTIKSGEVLRELFD